MGRGGHLSLRRGPRRGGGLGKKSQKMVLRGSSKKLKAIDSSKFSNNCQKRT